MDFEKSLTQLLTETFGISRKGTQFRKVFDATMDYLCRRTSHSQYHHALAATGVEFHELTPKQFRLMLEESGYILLNVRLYLLRLLKTPKAKLDSDFARKTFEEYGLSKPDAVFCWFYVRDNVQQLTRNNKFLKKLSVADVQSSGIQKAREFVSRVTDEVMKNAVIRAKYKLAFVWRHNNESHLSMATDLYIKAIHSYFKSVPVAFNRTDEHNFKYMLASMSTHTINLQKANSTHKNGRLINEGSDNRDDAKFVLVVQSESQMRELPDGQFRGLEDSVVSESEQKREIREVDLAVTRLCSRHSGTCKGELLNILFNRSIGNFMKFLRSNKLITKQQQDIVDVVGRMGRPKFFRKVGEYLKVSMESVTNFVTKLNDDLCIGEIIHA